MECKMETTKRPAVKMAIIGGLLGLAFIVCEIIAISFAVKNKKSCNV